MDNYRERWLRDNGISVGKKQMRDEWKIGNILTDNKAGLIRKIISKDTFALSVVLKYPITSLVRDFGNLNTDKAFDKEDDSIYLLNKKVRQEYYDNIQENNRR